jgi:hypothetical protein
MPENQAELLPFCTEKYFYVVQNCTAAGKALAVAELIEPRSNQLKRLSP